MVPRGREVSEEPMERGVSRRRTRTCGHSSQLSLMREASSFKLLPTILSLTFPQLDLNGDDY